MITTRWLCTAIFVVAVALGTVFLHFAQLAHAGVIGITQGPGPASGTDPAVIYDEGLAICCAVALGCVIAFLRTFRR